jgi:hypothetical protein
MNTPNTLGAVEMTDREHRERPKDGHGRFTRSLDAARKRDRAVELRAKGWTFAAIAADVGYSHAAAAQKAVNTALSQIPQASCEELIRAETARLEEMDAKLAEIIADPPVQHSAIGKVVLGIDGEPVRNMTVVIAALKERRMVGESLRRMRGADKGPQATQSEIERQYQAAMDAARAKRAAELAELDGYRALAAATPQPGDRTVVDAEIVPT